MIRYYINYLKERVQTCPICKGYGLMSEWHPDPADMCGFCGDDGYVPVHRRYSWLWFWKKNKLTPHEWVQYHVIQRVGDFISGREDDQERDRGSIS